MPKGNSSTGAWWVLGSIIFVVGGLIALIWSQRVDYDKMTTRQIALHCTTDMATQFHIHPVLKIFINGAEQTIPANVGIVSGCMNAIHTHDATGMLHVEAPVTRDFTLSDFFAVWGRTFTKDQILDSKADDKHAVTMTVNGQPVDTYENTVLRDKDDIVITYAEK